MKKTKTYRINEETLIIIKAIREIKKPKYEIIDGKRAITGITEEKIYKSDAEIIERAIKAYANAIGLEI